MRQSLNAQSVKKKGKYCKAATKTGKINRLSEKIQGNSKHFLSNQPTVVLEG